MHYVEAEDDCAYEKTIPIPAFWSVTFARPQLRIINGQFLSPPPTSEALLALKYI
jgi:hypothetical protein